MHLTLLELILNLDESEKNSLENCYRLFERRVKNKKEFRKKVFYSYYCNEPNKLIEIYEDPLTGQHFVPNDREEGLSYDDTELKVVGRVKFEDISDTSQINIILELWNIIYNEIKTNSLDRRYIRYGTMLFGNPNKEIDKTYDTALSMFMFRLINGEGKDFAMEGIIAEINNEIKDDDERRDEFLRTTINYANQILDILRKKNIQYNKLEELFS